METSRPPKLLGLALTQTVAASDNVQMSCLQAQPASASPRPRAKAAARPCQQGASCSSYQANRTHSQVSVFVVRTRNRQSSELQQRALRQILASTMLARLQQAHLLRRCCSLTEAAPSLCRQLAQVAEAHLEPPGGLPLTRYRCRRLPARAPCSCGAVRSHLSVSAWQRRRRTCG